MRLVVLIIGGVAIGAGSVSGMKAIAPHMGGSMSDAVRALGGNPSSFRLSDININPLKAYEDVRRQITSGNLRAPFDVGSSSLPTTSLGRINLTPQVFKFDEAAMKRAWGASINGQIQQNYNRSQDLAAYGRNPMAWHGAPPH
jgi:hypothetical protein